MNDLEKYFKQNKGKLIHKWVHYFDIYDRYFSRYRGTDVHLLEIGVDHGGSLQMWKDYFGPQAKIYGVDNNPNCKQLEEDQIEIFIGDQEDRGFLQRLSKSIPRIDILIDDGGHTMKQQVTTFEELFPAIDAHGIYLCEDLHTSYSPTYGGGYKKKGTYIEYSKNFIDYINAWYTPQSLRLGISDFTKSVKSLHFYSSVLVIEKCPIQKPYDLMTGNEQVPEKDPPEKFTKRLRRILRAYIKN